jgi:SAM-dependent methyltransferase
MSEEVIKDYTGRDYRTVWHGPRAAFDDRFEGRLIRELLPREPGWFVDVGAGYGRIYPDYARSDRRVVLVDYAVNLLETAAENLSQEAGVYFVAANAYHLPFRPAAFDAGISIRTFHHMASPHDFLGELGRVLRRGAHGLLEYSNKRNLLRMARYGRSSLRRDHEEYGDLLFGTHPAYMQELASSAGFDVGRTAGTGFFTHFVTERTQRAAGAFGALEWATDRLLGGLDLAPVSFAELVKTSGDAGGTPDTLADILQCPACSGAVTEGAGGMTCDSCRKTYPKAGAVYDFKYQAST